jgi:hypothetical protein
MQIVPIVDFGNLIYWVEIEHMQVKVYDINFDEETEEEEKGEFLFYFTAQHIFHGHCHCKDRVCQEEWHSKGPNSLLCQMKDQSYVSIVGKSIIHFSIPQEENIQVYFSNMGPNVIPFPFAKSTTHFYFFHRYHVYVPIQHIPPEHHSDPYVWLYEQNNVDQHSHIKLLPHTAFMGGLYVEQ